MFGKVNPFLFFRHTPSFLWLALDRRSRRLGLLQFPIFEKRHKLASKLPHALGRQARPRAMLPR